MCWELLVKAVSCTNGLQKVEEDRLAEAILKRRSHVAKLRAEAEYARDNNSAMKAMELAGGSIERMAQIRQEPANSPNQVEIRRAGVLAALEATNGADIPAMPDLHIVDFQRILAEMTAAVQVGAPNRAPNRNHCCHLLLELWYFCHQGTMNAVCLALVCVSMHTSHLGHGCERLSWTCAASPKSPRHDQQQYGNCNTWLLRTMLRDCCPGLTSKVLSLEDQCRCKDLRHLYCIYYFDLQTFHSQSHFPITLSPAGASPPGARPL